MGIASTLAAIGDAIASATAAGTGAAGTLGSIGAAGTAGAGSALGGAAADAAGAGLVGSAASLAGAGGGLGSLIPTAGDVTGLLTSAGIGPHTAAAVTPYIGDAATGATIGEGVNSAANLITGKPVFSGAGNAALYGGAGGVLSGALGGLGSGTAGTATAGAPSSAAAAAPSASGLAVPAGAASTDLSSAISADPAVAGAANLNAGVNPGLTGLSSGGGSTGTIAAGGGTGGLGNLGNIDKSFATSFPASSGAGASAGASQPLGGQIADFFGATPGGGISNFAGKYGGDIAQAGILGAESIVQQNKLNSLEAPLTNAAKQAKQQGNALDSAIFGGQLPAGAQAAVNQSTQAQKAQVRSTYANLGLSGSTMEADALAQVDQAAAAQTFNFAQNLLQTGLGQLGASSGYYNDIIKAQMQQDQDLGSAFTGLAAQFLGNQPPTGKASTSNVAA